MDPDPELPDPQTSARVSEAPSLPELPRDSQIRQSSASTASVAMPTTTPLLERHPEARATTEGLPTPLADKQTSLTCLHNHLKFRLTDDFILFAPLPSPSTPVSDSKSLPGNSMHAFTVAPYPTFI